MPGAIRYDVFEKTMALMKAVAEAGETITLENIRSHIEALNVERFNPKQVNLKPGRLVLSKPAMVG